MAEFFARTGHSRVPRNHVVRGIKIGSWAARLRSDRTTLSPNQVSQLDALGFVWNIDDEFYEKHLLLLKQFVQREGHANVPTAHYEETVPLGAWVHRIRHGGRTLSPARKAFLDQLGFVWDAREKKFSDYAIALQAFVQREGHSLVPRSHYEGNLPLGAWVQRTRFLASRLSSSRKDALNKIGFVWQHKTEIFEKNVALLKQFILREGHAKVTFNHLEDGARLGSWVVAIRSSRLKLDRQSSKRLDAMGFVWEPYANQYARNLELLRDYAIQNGHVRVPHSYEVSGVKLGFWVANMRQRKVRLSDKQTKELDALGFIWDAKQSSKH